MEAGAGTVDHDVVRKVAYQTLKARADAMLGRDAPGDARQGAARTRPRPPARRHCCGTTEGLAPCSSSAIRLQAVDLLARGASVVDRPSRVERRGVRPGATTWSATTTTCRSRCSCCMRRTGRCGLDSAPARSSSSCSTIWARRRFRHGGGRRRFFSGRRTTRRNIITTTRASVAVTFRELRNGQAYDCSADEGSPRSRWFAGRAPSGTAGRARLRPRQQRRGAPRYVCGLLGAVHVLHD